MSDRSPSALALGGECRGAFRGLQLGARLVRADVEAAKRPPSKRNKAATTANGAGKVSADVDTSEV